MITKLWSVQHHSSSGVFIIDGLPDTGHFFGTCTSGLSSSSLCALHCHIVTSSHYCRIVTLLHCVPVTNIIAMMTMMAMMMNWMLLMMKKPLKCIIPTTHLIMMMMSIVMIMMKVHLKKALQPSQTYASKCFPLDWSPQMVQGGFITTTITLRYPLKKQTESSIGRRSIWKKDNTKTQLWILGRLWENWFAIVWYWTDCWLNLYDDTANDIC